MVYTLYYHGNPARENSLEMIRNACYNQDNKGVLHIMRERYDGKHVPDVYSCSDDGSNEADVFTYHNTYDNAYEHRRSPTRRRNSPRGSVRRRSVRRSPRRSRRRFGSGRRRRRCRRHSGTSGCIRAQ